MANKVYRSFGIALLNTVSQLSSRIVGTRVRWCESPYKEPLEGIITKFRTDGRYTNVLVKPDMADKPYITSERWLDADFVEYIDEL